MLLPSETAPGRVVMKADAGHDLTRHLRFANLRARLPHEPLFVERD
jgi:hypothetical protein